MDNITIFDIETDGFNSTIIHVLSYAEYINGKWEISSLTDYNDIIDFLTSRKCLVGHNIMRFDIPELERLLEIKIDCRFIDTLALSYYLFPLRNLHGLESWGETFGIKKPEISDWEGLSIEEYTHRCEEDVKINTNLYIHFLSYLNQIYDNVEEDVNHAVDHLTFMLKVAAIQEANPFKLNVEKTVSTLDWFENEIETRKNTLSSVLPKVPKYSMAKMPKAMYRKDGSVSRAGERWLGLLEKYNLPKDHSEPFKYASKYEDPNPNSSSQIKNWLFSIGWEPETFNYTFSKVTKKESKVPQIKKDGNLCPSITKLLTKYPSIAVLEDLAVLSHRAAILKGFLSNCDERGYLAAGVAGFTNTLRYRHRVCVNLPGVTHREDFADGGWIRGCLTCDDGMEVCGSDVSALENMTMMNSINKIDPDYVNEMQKDGYDPHLSMGISAGIITKEESDFYKEYKSKPDDYEFTSEQTSMFNEIHAKRHLSKTTNYSATYLIGASKLARTLDISKKESSKLLEGFWKKNWALEKFSKGLPVKKIGDQMWIFVEPINMWLSLRNEKDRFSTYNQGFGSYVFFQWVNKILKYKPDGLNATFHDEVVITLPKGNRTVCTTFLKHCMQEVNNELGLAIPISIDVQFGPSYASVH